MTQIGQTQQECGELDRDVINSIVGYTPGFVMSCYHHEFDQIKVLRLCWCNRTKTQETQETTYEVMQETGRLHVGDTLRLGDHLTTDGVVHG